MSQRGVKPGLSAVREIGKTDNGTVVWSIFGGRVADTNNDTDDPKFTDEGGEDGTADDDDADEDDDKSSDDKDDEKDDDEDEPMYTKAEYDKIRNRMRAADRRAAAAEQQLRGKKVAKTEDTKDDATTRKDDEAERKRTERANKLVLENAFLRSNDVDWVDADDALKFVDLSEIDVDDDGTVDTKALRRILRDLAKRKPYLVKATSKSDDADDDDDDETPPTSRKLNGKRKGKSATPDRSVLERKYPALKKFGGQH